MATRTNNLKELNKRRDRVKKSVTEIHDSVLKNTDNLVSVSIQTGKKWQKIMDKAVKNSEPLMAKQVDMVFDTLETARDGLRTRFLLHYPTSVSISGNRAAIVSGPSRLICDTLLPLAAQLRAVDGFRLDTDQHPTSKKSNPYFHGAGHLEVEPQKHSPGPGTAFHFLHVLAIGPKSAPPGKRPRVTVSKDRFDLELDGCSVRLKKDGKSVRVKENN